MGKKSKDSEVGKPAMEKEVHQDKKNGATSVAHNTAQAVKETQVKVNNVNTTKEGKIKIDYTLPLNKMIERVNAEPPMKMVYSGIKEHSVGFIFGPSKSAKTIFCENLGMCIAAGVDSYLGLPIAVDNRKVLFVSLEEFYTARTQRNAKQVAMLTASNGEEWMDNYIVVDENMPRYFATDQDWEILYDVIMENDPGVVFIDSLSRLYEGSIEESKVAKEVMKRLRELSNLTQTTIIVVHHTPKLYNSPLSINSIAGSRIIAQDADFMIGLNKTLDGKRYIKDVAFRYASDDCETVKMFEIDDTLWLKESGKIEEVKLLSAFDGRRDDGNKQKLLDFIAEKGEGSENGIVVLADIKEKFVANGAMSGQTAHTQLNKLVSEGKIVKQAKGEYKVAA